MPCRDYESDSWGQTFNNIKFKEQADRLARIACAVLTTLQEQDKQELMVQILRNDEVREWWEAHQEADRKAREAEAEKKRIAKLKRDALAKLTPEEKKALGLRK